MIHGAYDLSQTAFRSLNINHVLLAGRGNNRLAVAGVSLLCLQLLYETSSGSRLVESFFLLFFFLLLICSLKCVTMRYSLSAGDVSGQLIERSVWDGKAGWYLICSQSVSLYFDTMPWGTAGLSALGYSGERRTGSREEEGEGARNVYRNEC